MEKAECVNFDGSEDDEPILLDAEAKPRKPSAVADGTGAAANNKKRCVNLDNKKGSSTDASSSQMLQAFLESEWFQRQAQDCRDRREEGHERRQERHD